LISNKIYSKKSRKPLIQNTYPKGNKIPLIMQEYFWNSMNLARIQIMAYMLHALCVE